MTVPQASPAAATAARTIALQLLQERGRGAVLVGVVRVDEALEHLVQPVMAPSTTRDDALSASMAHRLQLTDPAHSSRLAEAYTDARANPLWAPLETVLAAQPASPLSPLEPALRDYILLITILVVFLEATAQQRVGRCPL